MKSHIELKKIRCNNYDGESIISEYAVMDTINNLIDYCKTLEDKVTKLETKVKDLRQK